MNPTFAATAIYGDFNEIIFDTENLNFDTTNEYELGETFILLFLEILLYIIVFSNFRRILCWYYSQ
jgi:hypothetical protein